MSVRIWFRIKRGRRFTGSCIGQWWAGDPSLPYMTAASDYFARTSWAGTGVASFGRSAINMAARVSAGCKGRIRRPIGAAWLWRSSPPFQLLDDAWRSAPNHSQPQTCIERVEVDAEDYPPREPQNGQ